MGAVVVATVAVSVVPVVIVVPVVVAIVATASVCCFCCCFTTSSEEELPKKWVSRFIGSVTTKELLRLAVLATAIVLLFAFLSLSRKE